MTAKTEELYIEVLIWLRQECPELKPENMSMDFEVGEMNAGEAVFNVVPTGCDFHYNQAILRKIGKKGLKRTMSNNGEFKAWVHQVMSLNHLPSDKIEQTFRELCGVRISMMSNYQFVQISMMSDYP